MVYPKYKRSTVTVVLAVLLTMAGGCKKLIEIDPPINSVNTGVVLNDPEKITAALSGIYYTLMTNTGTPTFSNGHMTVYGGLLADELYPYSGAAVAVDYQFYTNKLLLQNELVQPIFWTCAYKAIYLTNALLENIRLTTAPVITDSIKRQLTGECRFARAFCYAYLVNNFGDVPMPLSTAVMEEARQKRQPVEKVREQMVEDLKAAAELLPDNFNLTQGEKVRPNKYAAIALLARQYLYMGKWEDAVAQATVIINSGKFSLTELEKTFGPGSAEAIWQMKHAVEGDGISPDMEEPRLLMPQASLSLLDPASREMMLEPDMFREYSYMFIAPYIMTAQLVQAFEPGDKRLDKWTDSLTAPAVAPWNGISYRFAAKYPRFTANQEIIPPYYTVLRLGEQYLIRAEARAHAGDLAGAATDLNTIRSRAGLPATRAASGEALLDAVAQERRVELFVEWGHRWFDLKRTGKAADVLGKIPEKQPWSNDKLLLFIPPSEIQNAPALSQNPGYTW
ncbi:RagB/SusD family nutrient uptake outer membrane protein [Chitinophaga qingshengii]|uniref:RagB/SusD family nutrient uptake outer membrane protein n=1 Tax=Chitinophaga qingshengii TaxID=1569794 RepID=A0ABR7TQZ9_9BACT|nr:RagB/SusD family nutrient uptake outer membrane protein [Chitinophaga qingshengii]MBC9931844.1 RagB/SusD family nutrient uptake outer membrane protein [Chitinophaga qingshengii]